MTAFTFNEAFRNDLRSSPHHWGEVTFLESVLRPGMTVIEGGANRGVTAVTIAAASGRTGRVHAFEPVPEYFDSLQTNIVGNGVTNIRAYNLALSDRTGELTFYKHGEGSGITPVDDAEVIRVSAVTITDFLATCSVPGIDFVNLDCEGCEEAVLRHAGTVLQRHRPGIFCEVHRGYLAELGHSVHSLVAFLTSLGYNVRPIQAEDLGLTPTLEQCSHIYAAHPQTSGATS